MKLLHLSDLHIGKSVNGFPMLEDQRHILRQALEIARDEHVDAILLAGDLYDKSNPSADAVNIMDAFFTAIAESGIRCFAIPGNHDSPERVAYASSLLGKQGIHIAPLFDGTVHSYTMEDEYGIARIWLLPFMRPATARLCYPESADAIGQDYTAAIKAALSTCDIDDSERNILVAHQFVTFQDASPELSDSELSLGGLDNVDAGVFDQFDYVALGHIHRPQRIGRDTIRYAGSPLKYSISEIRSNKVATIVTMHEKGQTDIESVAFTPLHEMREIKGPIDELIKPEFASAGNREDYIHAVLTDEQTPIDALSRIRSVYPNTMAIDYDNARTRSSDGNPMHPDDQETANPLELFEAFYKKQNGCSPSQQQQSLIKTALKAAFGEEETPR